jgi:hypothetical protein
MAMYRRGDGKCEILVEEATRIISEAEAEAIAQSQGMTANTSASPDRGDDHPRHLQEETTHDWAVHAP